LAVGQTAPYIRDYYARRGGNNHGLPVGYVGVSLMSQTYLQPYVDQFIDEFGIDVCAHDYNANPLLGPVHTNGVHDLFQAPFVKPVLLVINCVSNSPSRAPGELLFNLGGGPADWPSTISSIRAAIDSVAAPPPRLTDARVSGGRFQFTFPGQIGKTNHVESTTNLLSPESWTLVRSYYGSNAPITFRDNGPFTLRQRFFRVRRQ
jgi:hypothetical protein